RRLVEEQRGDQRRGADEVAAADDRVVRVLRLELRDIPRDIFGAADSVALGGRHDGVLAEGAGRLQVAVEIVEADDLDVDRRGRGLCGGGAGERGGERRGEGEQGGLHGVGSSDRVGGAGGLAAAREQAEGGGA